MKRLLLAIVVLAGTAQIAAQESPILELVENESLPIRDFELEQVRSFIVVRGTVPDQSSLEAIDRIVRTSSPLRVLNVITIEEPVSDEVINRSVERALHLNENLDSANISVNVVDGVVELTGLVGTELEVEAAADMASTVDGVVAIENRLVATDD